MEGISTIAVEHMEHTALNINCCNHQSCLIKATNDWLGVDPCVGDTKTLEWTMICRGNKKRMIIRLYHLS